MCITGEALHLAINETDEITMVQFAVSYDTDPAYTSTGMVNPTFVF